MKLLTVNQIVELQLLTFMYKAFKRLLPVNLLAHFNLNTGNKRYQNNFNCQFSDDKKAILFVFYLCKIME